MNSLKELYKIGRGPSSSHTMAPERACLRFMQEFPDCDSYKVTLFGSLSLTGKGHGTDVVVRETLNAPVDIVFSDETDIPHPNTMDISGFRAGEEVGRFRVLSTGGGAFRVLGEEFLEPPQVYALNSFQEIKEYCQSKDMRLWEYVKEVEGEEIFDYLSDCWNAMKQCIEDGLHESGVIPGGLEIERKARFLFRQHHIDESPETRENRLVCSFAYAVSEQNACRKRIVTAPTCGACGVVPAVLKYTQMRRSLPDEAIVKALATAGIIGNLVKHNASISGAECGCQAEIGTACCMASAALAELFEMDLDQIEYAAEVSMEHHLGLTCDPVNGLVQIPCIERNAVAAMRALNALSLANFLTYTRKVSFDTIVETMYETGKDLSNLYRETSKGGLAKLYTTFKPKKGNK